MLIQTLSSLRTICYIQALLLRWSLLRWCLLFCSRDLPLFRTLFLSRIIPFNLPIIMLLRTSSWQVITMPLWFILKILPWVHLHHYHQLSRQFFPSPCHWLYTPIRQKPLKKSPSPNSRLRCFRIWTSKKIKSLPLSIRFRRNAMKEFRYHKSLLRCRSMIYWAT